MQDFGAHFELARYDLGPVNVRPAERTIETSRAIRTLEPLVMRLLVLLSRRAGRLTSRSDIFAVCWGTAPVGDDSLNRLVAVLRKALEDVAPAIVRIETVPGAGYVLRLSGTPNGKDASADDLPNLRTVLDAAYDSWRLGLPEPDHLQLETMRRICLLSTTSAEAWGMLALLCRQAAEYSEGNEIASYVAECQASARRALALDPDQAEALAALAGVLPLYGRWLDARIQLKRVLSASPTNAVANHDLAMLEMATGRVGDAKALMDKLVEADPLAACFYYKSMYQHWATDDLLGMDHVGDRAIQLWPTHPAVWTARLWTLAHTDRLAAALAMLDDVAVRPPMPQASLDFIRLVVAAAQAGTAEQARVAADASRKIAALGPAHAISAMFALGLLKETDALLDVTHGYFLRRGPSPVPIRHMPGEMSINDQHRRVSQILFTPVFAKVRQDSRFSALCETIGLSDYWRSSGLQPDYLDTNL